MAWSQAPNKTTPNNETRLVGPNSNMRTQNMPNTNPHQTNPRQTNLHQTNPRQTKPGQTKPSQAKTQCDANARGGYAPNEWPRKPHTAAAAAGVWFYIRLSSEPQTAT
ncbi:hypothetical protein BS47DRAFT_1362769 [Hydnum rufescens UP504]|uniref:Uncharacterized protein n=1 Tax=Hydnum rufescens UP504 TaxID=1448309 RepID=A0A9P6AVZ2_9AGAM|nr:hypothetical protein BS47DRAFT_1362769 [Hydnum rufescens UP504]